MKRRPKRMLKQPNVFVSLFSEYKNKPLPLRTGALIVSGQNKIPAGMSRRETRYIKNALRNYFYSCIGIVFQNLIESINVYCANFFTVFFF